MRSSMFMKRMVLVPMILISILTSLAVLSFATSEYYDEIRDEKGQVRPQYKEIHEEIEKMTDIEKRRFLRDSKKAFSGDNALDPMPRIIPAEEYDQVLKKGVEQRGRAIQAFLKDHYSGTRSYIRNRIIPEDVVRRLLERSLEKGYDGKIPADIISFMYGPDIIRDRKGTWRVIEDNPGFIGGLGDLRLAQDYTLSQLDSVNRIIRFRRADEFYKTLTDRFKERAAQHGGKAVMYMTGPAADKEDHRIRLLMEEMGIRVVTSGSRWQFHVNSDGVHIYDTTRPQPQLEKVGFVFLNGEHSWLDPHHPENLRRFVIEEARSQVEDSRLKRSVREALVAELNQSEIDINRLRAILRSSNIEDGVAETLRTTKHAAGLTEAILSRAVDSNYTPGVDFIGDKEFYIYVEKLIEHYLGEKPILRNIPTRRFSVGDGTRLDQRLFDKVFGSLESFVVKKVDGRGGDAVWVGPKIKPEEIEPLKEIIRASPAEFIVQEFTPLSRMGDNIVDLRVIADVAPKSVFVTDTPWGRGLPASGNGKVNLSDQGREITVLVRTGSWGMCRQLFYTK